MTTPRENTGDLWADYDSTSAEGIESEIHIQATALRDVDQRHWADPKLR